MQRMGMVIAVAPEAIEEYKRLHANVWPEVLEQIAASGIRNYTIFLREPENLLFGTWEYHGTDFAADMEKMAQHEPTQRWWAICNPLQRPLQTRADGEWWAMMEEVFHTD